jgi:hypothetical protein
MVNSMIPGDTVIAPQRFRMHCCPYGEVMLYSTGKWVPCIWVVEPGPREIMVAEPGTNDPKPKKAKNGTGAWAQGGVF